MKKFNNKPNECIKHEGKEYWISRSVAICSIVLITYVPDNEKYILISKRGKGAPDENGKWNLICGYLDWNENGVDAAKREIYEETGLDIDKFDFAYSKNPFYINTEPEGNKQNVTLRFLFELRTNSIVKLLSLSNSLTNKYSEKDEVEDIRFIKLEDYKNYNWAFNHKEIVEELIKNIK